MHCWKGDNGMCRYNYSGLFGHGNSVDCLIFRLHFSWLCGLLKRGLLGREGWECKHLRVGLFIIYAGCAVSDLNLT